MDARAASELGLAARLARRGARLLEGPAACKRRAGRVRGLLEDLAARAEEAREADVADADATRLEASVRETLVVIEAFFPARGGLAAQKARILLRAREARRALAHAEQRLQACLRIWQPEDRPRQGRRAGQANAQDGNREDDLDDADALEDLRDVLATLRGQGTLDQDPDEVLQILQDDVPDRSAADPGSYTETSRHDRQVIERLVKRLKQAEQSEAATLDNARVSIDDPLEVLHKGHFSQLVAGTLREPGGAAEGAQVVLKRARFPSRKIASAELLLRQAEGWANLEHPNIVRLFGSCVLDGRFNLVMERCDLVLEDVLYTEAGGLSLDDKEIVVRSIARGLAYLHSHEFVHQRLSPSSVLMSIDRGLVKLTGFHIPLCEDIDTCPASIGYMAPEVLQAPARWTTRADIFSLAIVMWEIYQGERWTLGGSNDFSTRVLLGERPPLSAELEKHAWVDSLLRKCWEHDPRARPSASEVLQAMHLRPKARRSTRIIRGLISAVRSGRKVDNERTVASQRLVHALVRELADLCDESDLIRTLAAIRALLQGESENEDGDPLRAEARSRGILAITIKLLEEENSPAVLAGALWVTAFALSGDLTRSFHEVAEAVYGLATTVHAMMRTHAQHADIQAAACRLVQCITYDDDGVRLLLGRDLNIGKEIQAAMRAHPLDEPVQNRACGAMWNLAHEDMEIRASLGQVLGVGTEIQAAMRRHPHSARLATYACATVANLAIDDLNCKTLGQEQNVGKDVLLLMRKHLGHEELQEMACAALNSLGDDDIYRATLVQELGAVKDIVAAMRAHRMSEAVQEDACTVLWTLLDNFRTTNRLPFSKIAEVSADILAAMRSHPDSAYVQEAACGALWGIACDGAEGAFLCQSLHAGKDVAAAMRTHRGSEDVQYYACSALWDLAENDSNKVILGQDLKIAKDIAAAMRAHRDDEVVQTKACGALKTLARGNRRNAVLQGQDLNVGQDVVVAMRAHAGSEDVQEQACGALEALAVSTRIKKVLVQDLKAGEQIVLAMRSHRQSEPVQRAACSALSALAASQARNCETLALELSAGEEILAAIRDFPDSDPLLEDACGALYSLTMVRDVKVRLRELGATETVQRVATKLPSSRTAQSALQALE